MTKAKPLRTRIKEPFHFRYLSSTRRHQMRHAAVLLFVVEPSVWFLQMVPAFFPSKI